MPAGAYQLAFDLRAALTHHRLAFGVAAIGRLRDLRQDILVEGAQFSRLVLLLAHQLRQCAGSRAGPRGHLIERGGGGGLVCPLRHLEGFRDCILPVRSVEHGEMHVEIFAQAGEVEADAGDIPVLEGADRHLDRFAGEIRCRDDPVHAEVDLRERLQHRGDIGVIGAERLLADGKRALGERFGLAITLQGDKRVRSRGQAVGHVEMIGPEILLHDRDRALEKRQALSRPARIAKGGRQIAEALCDIGVLLGKHLFPDCESAPQNRLGLGVAAEPHIGKAKIVKAKRNLRMVLAERLLLDGDRSLVKRQRVGVASPAEISQRQIVESDADVRVVGGKRLLLDVEGAALQRLGQSVASGQTV